MEEMSRPKNMTPVTSTAMATDTSAALEGVTSPKPTCELAGGVDAFDGCSAPDLLCVYACVSRSQGAPGCPQLCASRAGRALVAGGGASSGSSSAQGNGRRTVATVVSAQ